MLKPETMIQRSLSFFQNDGESQFRVFFPEHYSYSDSLKMYY
jgi:hypothetical protein